jgi:D-alanine transaminase
MSRIVYVNGAYLPEEEAKVSVFDRAFLFGDAVYEVTAVVGGRLVDFAGHLERLDRSLSEIALKPPLSHAELRAMHEELVARNGVHEGGVYLQITRGVADRDFLYRKVPRLQWRPSRKAAPCWSTPTPPRGSRSSPYPTSAGSAATSSRPRCSRK